MENYNFIIYQIKPNDNLYEIAKKYNTTVEKILEMNKHIDPYHLLVGSYIMLNINKQENTNSGDFNMIKENMRKAWEQHVFWTRLLIVSIIDNLKDEEATTNRLLKNPADIAKLYQPYYGVETSNIIENLIREHLIIGADLIHAYKDNDQTKIEDLNKKWYKNADDIARSLASISENYDEQTIREMMYRHLDLTKEEVSNRLNNNHVAEINTFDILEEEALMMADYFTKGIINQNQK